MISYGKNNPSFGSSIRISQIAYAKKILDNTFCTNNCIAHPWTIYQSKYLTKGYSEDASYCTMGVIKNQYGNGFIFHLRPTAEFNKIIENIQRATENLRIKNHPDSPLTGLLVGGSNLYKPSKNFYNSLISLFKELNIKHSAFLGQKENPMRSNHPPFCNLIFDGNADEYIISPFAKENHNGKLKTLKDLQEFFETVIIRKDDTVKFN